MTAVQMGHSRDPEKSRCDIDEKSSGIPGRRLQLSGHIFSLHRVDEKPVIAFNSSGAEHHRGGAPVSDNPIDANGPLTVDHPIPIEAFRIT